MDAKAPNENPEYYRNIKDYHSIVLQGLVSKYLFRDIFASWTGK